MRATGAAHARAALVGNPSDGFGGATIAVPLRNFSATATVSRERQGAGASSPLVAAALRRFRDRFELPDDPTVGVSVATSIPREVGLGGSSAIVIAVLRALCELHGARLDRDELAALALACETEELGIAAGPQDRVVQAHDTPIYMDFSGARAHEHIEPHTLPPLFVAYCPASGAHSGGVHSDLRQRHAAGEARVTGAMGRLAALAADARRRLRQADWDAFGALMRESLAIRSEVVALQPRHARLIELADEHGVAANYAGSGGAIVGVVPPSGLEPLAGALAGEGFEVVLARIA